MIHTSARSESNFKYLVLLALFIFSVDILYVSTTLITLSNVHITSIFIYPYQSHVKLKIYAVLLCKNISESILYVPLISYCSEIRAIYRQCLEMLNVNCSKCLLCTDTSPFWWCYNFRIKWLCF